MAARTYLPRKLPLPGTFAQRQERDETQNLAAAPVGMTAGCWVAGWVFMNFRGPQALRDRQECLSTARPC